MQFCSSNGAENDVTKTTAKISVSGTGNYCCGVICPVSLQPKEGTERAPRFDYCFPDKSVHGIKGRFPLPSGVCSPCGVCVISAVKRQIAFIRRNRRPCLGCRVGDLGRERLTVLSSANSLCFPCNPLRHILIEF